jgi:acetyltransferase
MRPLQEFFTPSSVAVIGATEAQRSAGRSVIENLGRFTGPVYLVNPKHATIMGRKTYPAISDVPGKVDLAIIVTPAVTVPQIVAESAAAGVPAAIIISAGFKEIGERGLELEREILAARGAMRIIGPNCLGLMAPITGLNATFAATGALPGSIGFLSQSGALCTSILDWSLREMVGFSAFVSIGSMLDVGWGDLIDYLGDDPHTRAILMYMESVGDARRFLSAAREVALTKPIIVMKAGQTEQAAKAASSHTGALTGSDEVLDAALRRSGVLRVRRISDLFYMAEVLSKQPRPQGPRLVIVTNAGGPGVLATDALIREGGELAELSKETIAALDEFLPSHWSHGNPVDVLGDATPDRFSRAVEIASKDPNTDGLLVALAPQGITSPAEVAECMKPFAKLDGKPVLASWMGGATIARGEEILNAAGIPTFPFPDTAARAFADMWRYADNLRLLYETPELAETDVDQGTVRRTFETARASRRTLLTEAESKQILAAYGIPANATTIATTPDEAVAIAREIGGAAVLKLHSYSITHKTEVGGVELNLEGEDAIRAGFDRIRSRVPAADFQGVTVQPMIRVKDGYELILGSSDDPHFGPVLLFGSGGQLVEIYRDRTLALPPLNSTLARRMMERTKIYKALSGVRGRQPVDRALLEQVLVRFSRMVVEQPRIKEVDVNPLVASPERITALDARIVLHDWSIADNALPHTAIRPYPAQYIKKWTMRDGAPVTIRPIRPEDEPAMVRFHGTLSEQSVYSRYFHHMNLSYRVSHERLTRICYIDYDREMVLVAETADHEIVAAGRLTRQRGSEDAEFAVLVGDPWQEQGLGTELMRTLLDIGRREHMRRIFGQILTDNRAMQDICKQLGFALRYSIEDRVVAASIELPAQ